MAEGNNYLHKEVFWLSVHRKQPKGKGKTLADDLPPDTDWYKSRRLIVKPLALVLHLIFSCALICGNGWLPTNRGWREVKVQALTDASLVLELHILAAVFQPMAVFKKRDGETENPSNSNMIGFLYKSCTPVQGWDGGCICLDNYCNVTDSIPCLLTSIKISGTWEMFNHVLVTTLWFFTEAVITWIMSSVFQGKQPKATCILIQPDLKDFISDLDLNLHLERTWI